MKKQPVRTCIVCRAQSDKKQLLRVVRNKEGEIFLDFSGKAAGRGAYVCDSPQCIEKCAKNRLLNRAFKQEVPTEVYDRIKEEYGKRQD